MASVVVHEQWLEAPNAGQPRQPMASAHMVQPPETAIRANNKQRAVARLANFVRLAAFPIFAGLALATSLGAGGMSSMLCSVSPLRFPLSGMGTMYAVMSIFHTPPWLALIARHESFSNLIGVSNDRVKY